MDCIHCKGTGKCRFAKMKDNGEWGDKRIYWWSCFLCGESKRRSVTDAEYAVQPQCRMCHGLGVLT